MKKTLIFMSILLIVVLSSCTGNVPSSEPENTTTTITLGIVEIIPSFEVDYTMWYVSNFNEENEHYNIEVVNYASDDVMRLWTELIAGSGSDIIYSSFYDEGFFDPLTNRDMLADLWTFVDADPVISRDDFFTNILMANQSADGSLRTIANQFTIPALISTPNAADHTQSLTTNAFLELISSALDSGMAYPFDRLVSGGTFVMHMLMYTDIGILDFDGGVSHFESQVFYDLLELASLLPSEPVFDADFSPLAELRMGNHIFVFDLIFNPDSIARLETLLGEFIILGFPTDAGGRHDALLTSNLGINKNSDNPDAAWSFVRQYLLPDSRINFSSGMPVRIDLFKQQVEESMMEIPSRYMFENGISIPQNALSHEGASMLRETIENVSFISRFNSTVANIVWEELPPLFSGNRTKHETARIIQSRVQLYLDERG